MSRTNIFELLLYNNSIDKDASRLDKLFTSTPCFELDVEFYHRSEEWTLKDFVDQYCFAKWKNRHRCLDVKDYLSTINYDHILGLV